MMCVCLFVPQRKTGWQRLLQGQIVRWLRSSSSAQTGSGWLKGQDQNYNTVPKQTVENTVRKVKSVEGGLILLAPWERKWFLLVCIRKNSNSCQVSKQYSCYGKFPGIRILRSLGAGCPGQSSSHVSVFCFPQLKSHELFSHFSSSRSPSSLICIPLFSHSLYDWDFLLSSSFLTVTSRIIMTRTHRGWQRCMPLIWWALALFSQRWKTLKLRQHPGLTASYITTTCFSSDLCQTFSFL